MNLLRKQLLLGTLFLFSAIFCSSAQQYYQEVIVKVIDPLKANPISGAYVDIDARVVESTFSGDLEMKSIEILEELNIEGTTDQNGVFTALVPVKSNDFYVTTKVVKNGYDTMINMATQIKKNEISKIQVEMLPDVSQLKNSRSTKLNLKAQIDNFVWMRKLELEKEKIELNYNFENSTFSQNQVPNSPNYKSYKKKAGNCVDFLVPEKVYVKGLIDGYTGQCGNRGFTGNINFQEYVAGVIAREMGSSFPIEALKAQSVASRTYALNNIEIGKPANCGHAYTPNIPKKCLDATNATKNVVVLYENNAITAFYSARCHGDFTRPASINSCALGKPSTAAAYCRSVACSGHKNCKSTEGGSLCCTRYNPKRKRNETVFGHGVGLCQRGSQGFANRGWGWKRIINRFYSNIDLSCTDECKSNLKIFGSIASGTYKSSKIITASGEINKGNKVIFEAPEGVVLNPEFEVQSGANFIVRVGEGCGSKNNTNASDTENGHYKNDYNYIKSVYPNPATTKVTIELKTTINDYFEIECIDLLGRTTSFSKQKISTDINKIVLSTEGLHEGLYFLQIKSKDLNDIRTVRINN